jgi:TonB family protein
MSIRPLFVHVILFAALLTSHAFAAAEAWLGRGGITRAVTINDNMVTTPRGQRASWQDDCIKAVAPEYPLFERAAWHQGAGVFRLVLNPSNGSVVTVIIVKSTGFWALDQSAVASFRQWRFKPRKWKQIEIPAVFVLRKPLPPIPSGATQLPFPQ